MCVCVFTGQHTHTHTHTHTHMIRPIKLHYYRNYYGTENCKGPIILKCLSRAMHVHVGTCSIGALDAWSTPLIPATLTYMYILAP